MLLSKRNALIKPSDTSKMRTLANELKSNGIPVVNFAAGELDSELCNTMRLAASDALQNGNNKYTPTLGTQELRVVLAEEISKKTGVEYDFSEIGVTAGAKQALYNAMMVLLNAEDEVIIPLPAWGTFPSQVKLSGGIPVFVETHANDYHLTADMVENVITSHTKAIIINSPNNPTGVIYDDHELLSILKLANKHNFWIIFDECYAELVRTGYSHHNIVTLNAEAKARTILVNSFSKSYAATGWRVGYFAAPKLVVNAIATLQSHSTSNPNSLAQASCLATLKKGNHEFIDQVNKQLQKRSEIARKIIYGINDVACSPTEGAFYFFLNISKKIGKKLGNTTIENVDMLCEITLKEAQIALVSGSSFGAPYGIRISYAISDIDVENGLNRLKALLNKIV